VKNKITQRILLRRYGLFAQRHFMFNDQSNLETYLATRRSGKPRDMVAPGPDGAQLDRIIALASRTPDHGKLFPWRFIKISDRDALADMFERALLASDPDARPPQIEAARNSALHAPAILVLAYAPQESAKIPDWEQEMSVGAVAMNILHAAHALGFVGCWITGWISYDEIVRSELCENAERIAGLFYFGTPGLQLEERPRPAVEAITRSWP
jgi:nitroreductase